MLSKIFQITCLLASVMFYCKAEEPLPATYAERDAYLRQLTSRNSEKQPSYAKAWYLRGVNDFEEGLVLEKSQKKDESLKLFDRAANALETAEPLLEHENPSLAAEAILLKTKAYFHSEKTKALAIKSLEKLWADQPPLVNLLPDPLDAYIFYGHLLENKPDEAISKLSNGIQSFPQSPLKPQAYLLLGTLYYQIGAYEDAEKSFQEIISQHANTAFASQALLWKANSSEKSKKDKDIAFSLRKQLLNQYPDSPEAAEAYFTLYSYQDYLQGDRVAIKHLNGFPEKYASSPFSLNVSFIIGLDYKRDRKTAEGKWLRHKNLIAAIDQFQDVENSFNTQFAKGLIPENKIEHYVLVKYRAQLEKGLANIALSNESQVAKKQVYLEFAQETLNQLLKDLNNDNNPYKKWITSQDPLWHLSEEGANFLAQTYIVANDYDQAEQTLTTLLKQYETAKITRGYFLSRCWSNLGLIAMHNHAYDKALECYLKAEDAAKGKVLSTDQRLDLWIQQSDCYQGLKDFDKATLTLSKVVNDDAVSGLRIKAMLLRAEINEKQGRYEVAKKQLEATSKKGGEWALKAKEKLEKDYGYQ